MATPKPFSLDKERKKLKKIIERMPAEKADLAAGMIADAAFMAEQLDKLREEIRTTGFAEEYKHGREQFGTKETVAIGVYLKMQKNYTATIKQLNDMLPPAQAVSPGSDLMAFVTKR